MAKHDSEKTVLLIHTQACVLCHGSNFDFMLRPLLQGKTPAERLESAREHYRCALMVHILQEMKGAMFAGRWEDAFFYLNEVDDDYGEIIHKGTLLSLLSVGINIQLDDFVSAQEHLQVVLSEYGEINGKALPKMKAIVVAAETLNGLLSAKTGKA